MILTRSASRNPPSRFAYVRLPLMMWQDIALHLLTEAGRSDRQARRALCSLACLRAVSRQTRDLIAEPQWSDRITACLRNIRSLHRALRYMHGIYVTWGVHALSLDTATVNDFLMRRGGAFLDAFVDMGCDIDVPDSDGSTLLIHAARAHRCDLVMYLLDHGADVHARDQAGRTAMEYVDEAINERYSFSLANCRILLMHPNNDGVAPVARMVIRGHCRRGIWNLLNLNGLPMQ